jgi:hypothetical protein
MFTTADIWTSDVELNQSDLRTGQVRLKDSEYSQKSWLLYQYNQSQKLKHSKEKVDSNRFASSLFSQALISEFTRTVAIVTPDGIEDFLNWASNLKFSWTY